MNARAGKRLAEPVSVGEAARDAAARLKGAGIASPALEARLLTGHAIGAGVERVLAERDRALTAEELRRLQDALARRAAHEPVAHIVGVREFWSLLFRVTPATLIPRPDSETLIEAALGEIADRVAPLSLLDLGTGSGCLLLALLSELPQARGTGVDIDAAAAQVARHNAHDLGLAGRARFVVADWNADGWQNDLGGPYDVIVSNPPYIAEQEFSELDDEVRCFEPRRALWGGEDGLDAYRLLAPGMFALLRAGGFAVVEVGHGQADAVRQLYGEAGFGVLEARYDLGGIPRAVLAAKPA